MIFFKCKMYVMQMQINVFLNAKQNVENQEVEKKDHIILKLLRIEK